MHERPVRGNRRLARRMVLPAFYRLASEGLLPRQWLLVGNGRSEMAHKHAASGLPMPHATHPVAIPKGAQNRRIWPFVTTRKSPCHTHTEH
jgi:Glucose-6-phosphate dehydrogenase, NAD binding domain